MTAVLDFALIAVLLADIWVTWGHRPAAPCACPPAASQGVTR